MSKLSELLNPIPTQQPSPSINTDNQLQQGHHNRYPSITSPLEALAIAASDSAPPDLSQTQLSSAQLVSSNGHQLDYSNSSSRPGSSHFPPPIPPNFSQAPNQQQKSQSPKFEDHSTLQREDGIRTLSDIADGTSRQLPPLRNFTPDRPDHSMSDTLANGLQIDLREGVDGTDDRVQVSKQEDISTTEQASDVVRQDSYNSPVPLTPKEPAEVESQTHSVHEPAEVKSEFADEIQATYIEPISNEDIAINNLEPVATGDSIAALDPATQALPTETKTTTVISEAVMSSQDSQSMVKSKESKKRPAPKSEKKVEKKGTASAIKKPAAKKRKIETESMDGTPFSQRSGTPVSSRASKTPAPRNRKQNSITPMNSSPAPASNNTGANEDEDIEEGSELFCICRKPDDHTWMIACDGGCEDWFHGRCVDMNERDGNLIDKYICPNCKEKGHGQTIWKPMCRLESCREPARVTGPKMSKYCSDEHGEQFMRKRALGEGAKADGKSKVMKTGKKRRRENYTDHDGNGDESPTKSSPPNKEDEPSILRGGVLRAPELKALTTNVQSLEEFRKLGEGVLSPPQTASPDLGDIKLSSSDRMASEKQKVVYTADEQERLAAIAGKRSTVKRGRALLGDREKFLGLVKGRAKSLLEELRKREGFKDICGFDARLTWSDEEFSSWRTSSEGQKTLETGILGPPSSPPVTSSPTITKSTRDPLTTEDTNNVADTDTQIPNGVSHDPSTTEDPDLAGKGICQKKRCERHKQWFKLQQTELAFEKEEFRKEMRALEREEKGVRERATIRHLEGGEGEEEEENEDMEGG